MAVDRQLPGYPFVGSNNYDGVRQAVAHLISLGHEEIGFIRGPRGVATADERYKGFRDAVQSGSNGKRRIGRLVFRGDFTFRSGIVAYEYFKSLSPVCTAIVASNDKQAIGLIHACNGCGEASGRDMSVIGFDDTELTFQLGLTSVRQNVRELAHLAVQVLVSRDAGLPRGNGGRMIIPTELIVRSSTTRVVATDNAESGDRGWRG